jgi:ABC-2 type transport system ATP-binding protein
MQQVLDIIRRDTAEERIKIDTPSQNLESYFLDVVRKARQNSAETSGATSGNRVAAYLRGEAEIKPQPDKFLERLTVPAPAKEELPPEPVGSTVDQSKLEALTRPAEPAPASTLPVAEPEPAKPVDLRQANEKLSGMLGKRN